MAYDLDLNPILEIATDDELMPLVEYLLKKFSNSLESDYRYIAYPYEPHQYPDLIADEIRAMGGNSFANLLRGGEGISYHKVVCDVADQLKVCYDKASSADRIEELIIFKLFEDAWNKMSPSERENAIKEIDGNLNFTGPIATVSIMKLIKLGGFKSYQLAVIVANAVSKFVLGRGLSFGANAALTKSLSLFAGPVGWVISGIWTAIDLAGPSYKTTIPCVIQVATIRMAHTISFNDVHCTNVNFHNNANESINKLNSIQILHNKHIVLLNKHAKETTVVMDNLGIFEVQVLNQLSAFIDLINRVQNRPEYINNGTLLYNYTLRNITDVINGTNALIKGLTDSGYGTAGILLAAGPTNAASMVHEIFPSGIPSGIDLINTIIALIVGDIIRQRPQTSTHSDTVELLIDGSLFRFNGSKLSDNPYEAEAQMYKMKEEIRSFCKLLLQIECCAKDYQLTISNIHDAYYKYIHKFEFIVNDNNRTDWKSYTPSEKKVVEICSMLTNLLYYMCSIQLIKQFNSDSFNLINFNDINMAKENANKVLEHLLNQTKSNAN